MTNQVTTKSINTLDIAAIARELAPKMANLADFTKDLQARRNAVALFVTTKQAALTALELTEGQRAGNAWAKMKQEEQFRFLAEIGTPKEAIDQMRKILASGPHRRFVTMGVEIVDQARACPSLEEFAAFIATAENEHRVVRNYRGEDAVILYDPAARMRNSYGPEEDNPLWEAAWPYVVDVWKVLREKWDLIRAERKDRWERISAERSARTDDLAKEVTPGLTLSEIMDGKTGKVLVRLDASRVALLDFLVVNGDYATVEILATNYSKLVWRPITVKLPEFYASDGGFWPDDSYGFPRALQEQLQREQEERELEQHLAALQAPDLLPHELEKQSMTRVLLGEPGSALAYHPTFSDNSSTGFLGVTISSQEGKFILAAVESEIPFSQDLVGKELPLTIQDMGRGNSPHIAMNLADVPEEHKKTLDMVRRLLIFRVNRENRQYQRR